MMANTDRIVEKVQKLFALAEGASTKEEAELAFSRAQELMTKHAIDEIALELMALGKKDVKIEKETIEVGTDRAVQELLFAVARVNNCEAIYIASVYRANNGRWRERTDKIEIWGRREDIEFAKMLFVSLRMHCERTLALAREIAPDTYKGKRAGYSFRIGFSDGVAQKLWAARKKVVNETNDTPGTELVLKSRRDAAREAMESANPDLKTRGGVVQASHGASYGSGFRSGQQADVSGGRNNLGSRKAIG